MHQLSLLPFFLLKIATHECEQNLFSHDTYKELDEYSTSTIMLIGLKTEVETNSKEIELNSITLLCVHPELPVTA